MALRERAPSRIWVVTHCEVFIDSKSHHVDEMVLFAASSRRAALRLIRTVLVESGTWWRIDCLRVDGPEGLRGRFRYYSRTGRPIRTPPYRQGLHAAMGRRRRQRNRSFRAISP